MKPRFGIFSGYDSRPWVMKEFADNDIKTLEALAKRIQTSGRWDIVYPGAKLKGWDKLCYTPELAESYAQAFVKAGVSGLINVHQTWTFPQTSQKVVSSYASLLRDADGTAPIRLLLASIQDTTVPGMVSGMATGGAYTQNGQSFVHVYGDFEAEDTLAEIDQTLEFFAARAAVAPQAREVVKGLRTLHAIEFGSFSLQMPTTRINQEELTKRWGITSESLDQQVFLDRAFGMIEWDGIPGLSTVTRILHPGVRQAVEGVYDKHPEKFAAVKGRSVSRSKYALQAAMYFATQEIAEERGASAVTIKCQDECSGVYATCCMATSFLGNDVDMNGKKKKMIPTSCETDLPTMYAQYLLKEISGKPSGFGDFRFVKTSLKGKEPETILAIVNCGQHPLYYAGKEGDSLKRKQELTDHPGQEHFYNAGGASVRMITAGGQDMTVARLGSENGRLTMTATVMETRDVARDRFDAYNKAWPIIEGRVPVTDKVLGRRWPSNHLAFVYGNHLPALIELSERMGIGYTVWDEHGVEYSRPS